MKPRVLLEIAGKLALSRDDDRHFMHGAVGKRSDGAFVYAVNGNPKEPTPQHHCEWRICRKLDRKSVVYVARVRVDGSWANSKPCKNCQRRMKTRGISKVYFTICENTWGCIQF